jgi:ATP-dependent RNA circularization protein (DNA/RNA ligase family)
MNNFFFKFPSTPHIASLGGNTFRDDKVLTQNERDEFLCHTIVVEEKIDGANLGISFDPDGNLLLQNRGGYLQTPYNGQWKKLSDWLPLHRDSFFDLLEQRYILFGEWCYARHSIYYNNLPDWFMGFDIYDRINGIFLPVPERNTILTGMEIQKVPELRTGMFTLNELSTILSDSKVGATPAEGIYLRIDTNRTLVQRAKLVRPEFIQSIERHWSKTGIVKNALHEEPVR